MPRAQIKDEHTYQKLREQGASKDKSVRIANASAGSPRKKVAAKGGGGPSYRLSQSGPGQARSRDRHQGRSSMSKAQLIDALHNH
jgi:hypothetical protein